MKQFDVCVIGAGGIVGSAVLRDLGGRKLSVVGLEKHDGPAREISGFNSRVIHSGFHETAGTLKARLAPAGSRMLLAYAAAKGVPLIKTGMLIAVPKGAIRHGLWREVGALWHLWRNGKAHNVEFRGILSPSGIRKIAPITAIGGIFIPSVAVVDIQQLIAALQQEAIENGVEIHYDKEIQRIVKAGDFYVISTAADEFTARILVNSAGLSAPEISRMAGGPEYSVQLLRGEYYELVGGIARWDIRTLVYPAMPARSPSKGIHFGPRTDGRLFLGPNAIEASNPPTPKETFLSAARRFLPQIREEDLQYSCAGIRPKYTDANGVSDFVIRMDSVHPMLINLIGIDSPGLSSSLAIAKHVGDMLSVKG